MKMLRFLAPVLSVVLLTFAAILPWGIASDNRFVLPLLPIAAICYWTLDPDAWLPEWVIFLAGLMLDVLTQGPLGYWALVYLVAYVVAVLASRQRAQSLAAKLMLFAGVVIAVTAFAWLAASAYFLDVLDIWPYVRGVMIGLLGGCLLLIIFRVAGGPARPVRLVRGR